MITDLHVCACDVEMDCLDPLFTLLTLICGHHVYKGIDLTMPCHTLYIQPQSNVAST